MPKGTCTQSACDSPTVGRGLCRKHYQRWWKHGDPATVKQVFVAPDRVCAVSDCDGKTYARTWCEMHYKRWRHYGDPHHTERKTGGYINAEGYRDVFAPGHPVAHSGGYAGEHRVVLHDAIGPGEHPCHWCGQVVAWDRTFRVDDDFLVVDHLDFDRLNNRPENLVPSCNPCNSGRTGG